MRFKFAVRVLSLILVLIFMTTGFLTSCGESSQNSANNNNPANTGDVEDIEVVEEENKITTSNLPERDWNGREIVFLVRGPTFNEWESQDIYAEEEIVEPVNDAV